MKIYLDFEKPVADLEGRIAELHALDGDDQGNLSNEIQRLQTKAQQTLQDLYKNLNPWQKTQVARHPVRPHFSDYVSALIEDFTPLSGDRAFAEDAAIVAGIGRFQDQSIMLLGHEKGTDTETRLKHNFGMARPEGYRKAIRAMELADRFGLPVVSLVDTAGAYPGIGAEERGQAEAIARSTEQCLKLGVPNIAIVIGEGGSGGAVALASTNAVLMLEHSIYTVASPEASASILWRDSSRAADAATAMKITAQDLKQFGVIDTIIPEPTGGAHRDVAQTVFNTSEALRHVLERFARHSREDIRAARAKKFREIGRRL